MREVKEVLKVREKGYGCLLKLNLIKRGGYTKD